MAEPNTIDYSDPTGGQQDQPNVPSAVFQPPTAEPTVSPEVSKNIAESMKGMVKVPEYEPSPSVHANLHYDSKTHKYVDLGVPNVREIGIPHDADANAVSDAVYSAYNKIFPQDSVNQKDPLTDLGKVVNATERMSRKGAEEGGKIAVGLLAGQGTVTGFEKTEDLPQVTPEEFAKENPVAAGVARSLGKTAGGFVADPKNWPLMFSGAAAPIFRSAIQFGFAMLMGKGTIDKANETAEKWDSLTADERAEAVTDLGLGAVMAVEATRYATNNGVDAITGTKYGEASHVATEINGKTYDLPKEHAGWMAEAIHKYTSENEPLFHGPYPEEAATKLQIKEGLTPEGANFSNEEIARQARGEKYYTISKGGNITAQMSQPDAASDLKGGVVVKTLPDGTMDVQRGDSSILDKYRDRLTKAIEPTKKMSVAEDWEKIQTSTEPDTEHVQTAFPTSDVSRLTDSSWKVKTPAGHDIVVVKTPAVSTEGSGITLRNNQYAAGSWQQVDTGGIMHLSKLAGQDTVHHEAFHAAWDLALDEADRAAVTKRYGSEEAAAEAYGKWNPQAEPHTMFEKIQNYFRRLYNSVVSPDKNLFEDVRSGKVWEEAADRRVNNDSSTNFSITTKPKWEESFSKLAPSLGGLDEAQIAKAKSAVNEVNSVMESMKELLPEETEGSAIKTNMDYLKTVDLNTICPRTNRFQSTIDGVQQKLGRILSGDERLDVAKNMQQHGHTSPCAYCYVEQGRNRMVNRVKRLASEAGVPERALIDDKFKQQLISDNPKMTKAIEAVQIEAKKPMTVNVAKPYVPYTAQILKWDQPTIDQINGRAGLRFFSSTDFQPEHMLDLMQVVSDAGARGLKAHGYTKEPDFVRTFGNTGIKINMSIHAKGGVEGSPIAESPESMPWKDAQQLRKQFPNAGSMMMVTNDAQLNFALKNDWVDMAIPFHGDRPAMYKTGPERWTDYSREQHETDIKTGKTAPRIDAKDHSNNVDTYLQLVQERGALPRFARFIYDNNDLVIKHGANGVSSVTLKPGVTQPRIIEANKDGYMKLIRDIARTDSPHEVVQPNFDTKQAIKVLKQWEKGGGTHREAIPEVVKDMGKQLVQIAPMKSAPATEEIGYHITPTKNVQSILKEGLKPSSGKRSQKLKEAPGTFLFKSVEDAQNALSNWLGDEFPENESLSILKVKLPKESSKSGSAAEFEHHVISHIPAKNIEHLGDADIYEPGTK